MPKRRRILALLCALVGALTVVGTAGADLSGGANHVVIAQNTTDGATVVHAGTQVVPTASDTVTSANIAAAVNAGCTGCHSTAVAVQILIVHGSPSYFAPGNVANTSGRLFTHRHTIQEIRRAIQSLPLAGQCPSPCCRGQEKNEWMDVVAPWPLSG